jgi:hypoxanthine phosphoribosyltransferase
MDTKITLEFTTISKVLKEFTLPVVDYVVGIATGSIIPASLIAHQLDRPLSLIEINFVRLTIRHGIQIPPYYRGNHYRLAHNVFCWLTKSVSREKQWILPVPCFPSMMYSPLY